MLRHCQYWVKTTLAIYLISYKLIFFESLIIFLEPTSKLQSWWHKCTTHTLMSLSPQRQREGGRGEGCHEILGNFADNCGWLLGRELWGVCGGRGRVFFLLFWRSTCTGSKSLFPNICKCFPTFFWLLLHWKFQGSTRSGISRGVHQKLMWNFHRSWFLTLEFSRVSHNSTEFPRVKSCFLWSF